MKVASFNINNVTKRLPNLLQWLSEAEPDVACLQELKAEQGVFPAEALRRAGYEAVWRGERNWNGVAILSRLGGPVLTQTALPGNPGDLQSRYIEAAVAGVLIGCIYLPNGDPQPGPKFVSAHTLMPSPLSKRQARPHSKVPTPVRLKARRARTAAALHRSKLG